MSADPGIVLVASPFTGPYAWSKLATVLRARGRRVAVHDVDGVIDPPVVLAGHSGAGPRLPAIAARRSGVVGMVLVDAPLPHPGRSWAETAPRRLIEHVRSLARDGQLPPWPQWWPEAAIRAALPDDATRARFVADCPSVPVALLDEVMPEVPEPPGGYVLLSEIYAPEADEAAAFGWPVVRVDGTHLSMLTDPERVADAITEVTAALPY